MVGVLLSLFHAISPACAACVVSLVQRYDPCGAYARERHRKVHVITPGMSYYKEVQTKRLFALEIYSFTRHYFLLRSIVLRHHVVLPDLRLLMRTARQMELPCMETPTPPAPLTMKKM